MPGATDKRGQAAIVGIILVVILLVAVFAILLVLPFLESRVCEDTTESLEKKWLEVVLDTVEPGVREVIPIPEGSLRELLEATDYLELLRITVELKNGRTAEVGNGYIHELYGRTFVAVALYTGCTLAGQSAQGYKKELADGSWKIAVVLALSIAAPSAVPFFGTLLLLVDMFLQGDEYVPGTPALGPGPGVSELGSGDFPDTVGDGLKKDESEYFQP